MSWKTVPVPLICQFTGRTKFPYDFHIVICNRLSVCPWVRKREGFHSLQHTRVQVVRYVYRIERLFTNINLQGCHTETVVIMIPARQDTICVTTCVSLHYHIANSKMVCGFS